MGIQINGNTDTITAIDGALTVSGAELSAVTNLNATGIVTASGFVGNLTGTASTATAAATAFGLSGSPTLSGITSVSTTNLTVNGNAYPSDGVVSGARNRIINGDMRIDQRNAGASVTVNSSSDFFPVDRFNGVGQLSDGVYTLQRSTTAPTGFVNSIIATVTTADASIGASQFYFIRQIIEGTNITDLGWGTANAQTVTLSFWVRSSLTGIFGGVAKNNAQDYSYPFTYAISSANTWEKKTITIPGPTAGTWLTDTSGGIQLAWSLGGGSSTQGPSGSWAAANYRGATGETAVISTNGATFYLTGVQLEAGTVATPFERRSYGQELALCQRYFCKNSNPEVVATNGAGYTTSGMFHSGTVSLYTSVNGITQAIMFPVSMRTAPSTITFITTNLAGSAGQWSIYYPNTWVAGSVSIQSSTSTGFNVICSGSWTAASVGLFYGAWTASVEL
jgi:hypothetical protein